jgi:CheY-like chemotaxis protein
MKKSVLIIALILMFSATGFCRDYVVDCISENYKEETEDYKHHLQIYHSIHINSAAGQKILVLKGENYRYRTWLREYISHSKKIIVKVPDDDNFNFISSKAYTIDVTSVYPVNDKKWNLNDPSSGLNVIKGKKHILIVDNNIKRRKLLRQVMQDLDYPVTILSDSKEALRIFQVQPDSFQMVIANYDIHNFAKTRFIERLSNISPLTPIIVGGAYNNKKINEKLYNDFSRMDNVIVRPVILEDLTKIVTNLLKNNV